MTEGVVDYTGTAAPKRLQSDPIRECVQAKKYPKG
jgi:hypothetical protein